MNSSPNHPALPEIESDVELRKRNRRKRELALLVVGVVSGFVVLPFLIFIVGTVLLGPYAGGKSAGVFFADFYMHLAQGSSRTWFIALAPYAAIWVVRLCLKRWSLPWKSDSPPSSDSEVDAHPARSEPHSTRREPFIS